MIKILIVKMSSMGDVLHALPVLNDIKQHAKEDVQIDWLTEPHYQFILKNHPHIHQLHTFPLRSFKKNIFKANFSEEAKALKQFFNDHPYDYIIDLQGLLKSAWLTRWAKGKRLGYDKKSIRESLASKFYHQRFSVSKDLHAITRMRELCAKALDYDFPNSKPNYGLSSGKTTPQIKPNVILFPFTTWASKHYPTIHWNSVIRLLEKQFNIFIAWGSKEEKRNAAKLAAGYAHCQLTPDLSIAAMKEYLKDMHYFIGVDTGFSHLATALDIPGTVLMGPTDKNKSGPLGDKQIALDIDLPCRPCHKRVCRLPKKAGQLRPKCLASISPELITQILKDL